MPSFIEGGPLKGSTEPRSCQNGPFHCLPLSPASPTLEGSRSSVEQPCLQTEDPPGKTTQLAGGKRQSPRPRPRPLKTKPGSGSQSSWGEKTEARFQMPQFKFNLSDSNRGTRQQWWCLRGGDPRLGRPDGSNHIVWGSGYPTPSPWGAAGPSGAQGLFFPKPQPVPSWTSCSVTVFLLVVRN